MVKYKLFNQRKLERKNWTIIGSVGIRDTTVGNYRADEGLQSIIAIGNQSPFLQAWVFASLMTDFGLLQPVNWANSSKK